MNGDIEQLIKHYNAQAGIENEDQYQSISSQVWKGEKSKKIKGKNDKEKKLIERHDEYAAKDSYVSISSELKEQLFKSGQEGNKSSEKEKTICKNKRKKQRNAKNFESEMKKSKKSAGGEGSNYHREKREIDLDQVVKCLKEKNTFLCIGGKKLYAFTGRFYENITDRNVATAVFKEILSEETNRLIRDYTEIYKQLLSDKEIWYSSMDEIRRNRNVIVFLNGTYDVLQQKFYRDCFRESDFVFSLIQFEYEPQDTTNRAFVNEFINTFCSGDLKKRELFNEITGFCLSNYTNKKACFYFLGIPNSGKSTICRFLETAVGSDAYISIAVKQLSGRFASGDLEGVKICADEDVAVKVPLKSEDISLIKKITSSDKIRTDAKYQQPGQLHPECKLVWAGNGMMTFETSEDLQPIIERMIIFPLEEAVPEEQRDPDIVEKLVLGRNYIISEALKALYNLVNRNFKFTKVVRTETYFDSKNFASGIEEFVEECCLLVEGHREYTSTLYEAYKKFCAGHPEYRKKSINQFSTYIEEKFNLEPFNSGEKRGKQGIAII